MSRDFSNLLNLVRYQGLTLEITRGNQVVAKVEPVQSTVQDFRKLQGVTVIDYTAFEQ